MELHLCSSTHQAQIKDIKFNFSFVDFANEELMHTNLKLKDCNKVTVIVFQACTVLHLYPVLTTTVFGFMYTNRKNCWLLHQDFKICWGTCCNGIWNQFPDCHCGASCDIFIYFISNVPTILQGYMVQLLSRPIS